MLQKQKLTRLIRHFVIHYATPAADRGALLFVSMGLVGVSINAHHVAVNKYPVSTHVAIVAAPAPAKQSTTPVVTPNPTPTPTPAPVITPSPTPTTTPKLNPTVSTPSAVTPTPRSNVSGLKATSGGSSNSNTSNGSSGNGTLPHSTSYSSTNWSGYMSATGVFTGITASWIVPNVSGNGHTLSADGTWIGIGGVTEGDLIQTGTQDIVSSNGQVSIAAFYEMLPDAAVTISDIAISPGDNVSASIKEVSFEAWTITIADNTDNDSYTTTVLYDSSNSSAEWIEEDPSYGNGNQVPFDEFGSVVFSDATTTSNGTDYTLASINPSSITLTSMLGQALAVPSAIGASNNSFSITHQ